MESLYSTVEIVKKLSDKKSIIKYYLLDDGDKYGVKITKTCNDKIVGEDEVVMKCLSKEKGVVTNLIDNLMANGNDFTQIQYVIEDYVQLIK